VKKSLAITLVVAALILVTALAILLVLSALAGQESGLQKSARSCTKLAPTACRAVTAPDREPLTVLARYTTTDNR
jgi:hypothetical protein